METFPLFGGVVTANFGRTLVQTTHWVQAARDQSFLYRKQRTLRFISSAPGEDEPQRWCSPGVELHFDAASEVLDDGPGQRQSEADAVFGGLCGVEGLKDAV